MPELAGRTSPHAPPKLVVSRPVEDTANTPTLASRRRSKTESSAPKGRSDTPEWIDVDDEPPRRRKRSSKRSSKRESTVASNNRSRRSTESEVGRFFPSLTRILESSESRPASRPGTSGSDSRKQREEHTTRRRRPHEDISVGYRRPVKHRVGGISRRPESGFKANPSLLSVLTSLTGNSDSSSSTTITQQSYDRRGGESPKDSAGRRRPETDSHNKRPTSPNVFDYMESSFFDDGHDGQSLYSSSSSSHYEHSDAGSSELPETPSSHSTVPSPTATRNSSLTGSVAELRRKYDAQYTASSPSHISARSDSHSPELATRGLRKLTKVRDVLEEPDEGNAEASVHSDASRGSKRSSSGSARSSRPMQRPEERLQSQEEAMRHHLAQSQYGQHMIEPAYGQHRSHSASSHGSATSARAYQQYMAMQQYHYPSPPAPMAYPVPPQATNGHVAHPDRPPVPDAPDLSQRTLAGYEQLAVELSKEDSEVKPIYRKFEYLNHRLLLHLQDELSEMEEQLRTIDEIIAQMEPLPASGQRPPASRRGDAFSGTEMHFQRTQLLGRIFQKTEQYNKAMSSFASMSKDSRPPEKEQVAAYQDWLSKKAPIHEVETRFLQSERDLILPGSKEEEKVSETIYRPTKHAALTCLPVALMLPLLLFALIPSLAGRLVVTALIAVGAFMVAATTRIRHLMPVNEWAVCGAAYVLLMAAIAGCIPQHST